METELKTGSTILSDLLAKLDVDAVGVASLADWKGTRLEDIALKLLPQARSVVVLAHEICQEVLDLVSLEKMMGTASLSDFYASDSDYICGRLTKAAYDIAKVSRKSGLKALPLPAKGCPTDRRFLEAVFSYKHAGQAAGLGSFGKSSLIITPDFGPRVRLSCCLTEVELEPTNGSAAYACARCTICIDNCPAGALSEPQADEPYALNKFACSSFVNASGGCSECLRLCPAGKRG